MEGVATDAVGAAVADGFQKYDEGTYGQIEYHPVTGEIRKKMRMAALPAPAAEDDTDADEWSTNVDTDADDEASVSSASSTSPPEYVEYSTVTELGFYGSLAARGGRTGILPILRHERVPPSALLYFTHAGTTLYKWIRKQPTRRRREAAPEILYQLTCVLADLYDLGVQNTDTKPANILVREDPGSGGALTISLIDYNLLSFHTRGASTGWTESFGTWCYCAPEILDYGTPTDTSPSWTLGILLASILIHFPYESYSTLKSAEINSRRFWLRSFKRLSQCHPTHLPLPPGYQLAFTPYTFDLYRRCTAWDPTKRPSLATIRDELTGLLRPAPERPLTAPVPPAQEPVPTSWRPLVPRRRRLTIARAFYAAFQEFRAEFPAHVFVVALLYLDRAKPAHLSSVHSYAALHLALLFYHQYTYDLAGLSVLHPLLSDAAAVWSLADALSWNLLIPVDLLIAAARAPDAFYTLFCDLRKTYTDAELHLKLSGPRSVSISVKGSGNDEPTT